MPAGDLTRDKNPPEVEALIGKQIPRIGIPGWSKLSGSLFESSQQSAQAMGLEVMDRGGKSIFLIELIDTKNDYATVLDAQILPKQPRYDAKGKPIGSRKENARLYSFTEGCQRENAEAVIVGTALPEQDKEHCGHWTKRVQRAWMIDPQTGRITEISPEGVSCLIESEYDCAN
jgi:hypothetical protein